jgi:ribosome modulation factor
MALRLAASVRGLPESRRALRLEVLGEIARHDEPELEAEDKDEEQAPVPGRLSSPSTRDAMMSGHHRKRDPRTVLGWMRRSRRDPCKRAQRRVHPAFCAGATRFCPFPDESLRECSRPWATKSPRERKETDDVRAHSPF